MAVKLTGHNSSFPPSLPVAARRARNRYELRFIYIFNSERGHLNNFLVATYPSLPSFLPFLHRPLALPFLSSWPQKVPNLDPIESTYAGEDCGHFDSFGHHLAFKDPLLPLFQFRPLFRREEALSFSPTASFKIIPLKRVENWTRDLGAQRTQATREIKKRGGERNGVVFAPV